MPGVSGITILHHHQARVSYGYVIYGLDRTVANGLRILSLQVLGYILL